MPDPELPKAQAPVRDDDALGPTEDLDRDLDGVPHGIVGMTALFSVVLALLVACMFLTGRVVPQIAAVALVVVAIPVVVSTLRRKAERERDHTHPAR